MGDRKLNLLCHLCRAVIFFTTTDPECILAEINVFVASLDLAFLFNQEHGPFLQNPDFASET